MIKTNYITIKDFNKKVGTSLNEEQFNLGDFYEKLNIELQKNRNITHYFTSLDKQDVEEDIEYYSNLNLEVEFFEIEGVYVALVFKR